MADPALLTAHLLDLFRGPLRDVRFPDADGERLAAALASEAAAAEAVMHAEASLEAARGALADARRSVTQQTERTLAYARVYAADRPELRAALDAVPTATPTRRGPGRPRKSSKKPETKTEVLELSAAE